MNSKADFYFYFFIALYLGQQATMLYTSLGVLEAGKQDENKPGTKIKAKRKHNGKINHKGCILASHFCVYLN